MARAECRLAFIVAFTLCFSQCQSWGSTRRLSGHGFCPSPSSSHGGGGGDAHPSPTQEHKERSSNEKEDATHHLVEEHRRLSAHESCDEEEDATHHSDEDEHDSRRLSGHDNGHDKKESGDDKDDTTDVSLALAYAAIFYVVFIMVVLYFLNYDCAFVRSASYKMLCTALSVYCAVLLNTAIMGFVVDQLISGKEGRGLNWKCIDKKAHAWMGALLSLFFLIGTNAGCHYYRRAHHTLKAVATLGAHLTAFAGIHAFWHIQNSDELLSLMVGTVSGVHTGTNFVSQYKYSFVVCIAIAVTSLVLYVSRFIREQSLKRKLKNIDRDHKGDYEMLERAKRDYEMLGEAWREEVSEAEGEAGGLVVGFLVMQVSIFAVTGDMVSAHGNGCMRSAWETAELAFIGLVFAVLLIVHAYIKTALHHKFPHKKVFQGDHTSVVNLRNNFKMSMAWCWARSMQWIMFRKEVLPILEAAQFAAALLASAVAIGFVFLLNRMMDRTSARKYLLQKWERFLSVKGIEDFSKLDLSDEERTKLPAEERDAINNFKNKTPAEKSFDSTGENTVANLTTGFAVLIGIAWDIAFATAENEIIMKDNLPDWLKEHKVLPKMFLAFFLVGVVLPGWAKYIIPAAQKKECIHFLNIFRARAQNIEADTKSPELNNERTNENP